MANSVRGRVSVHPRGFGFLTIDGPEGEQSAFIVPPDLNGLLDGDIAEATIVPADGGRLTAKTPVLVERKRTELFGTVGSRKGRPFLRVDRLVSNTDWPLDDAADAREGDALVCTIRGDHVVPLRAVASGADLGLERCVVRHGIRTAFPRAVITAAESAATTPIDLKGRRDLRDLPTVTIDAPTTEDIDDALSVLPASADGALRVLVSIADVDAFVAAGSPLDDEARLRATSVYLAGRVIPMLPDVLSTRAISLVEGVDRYAMTAELRIDPEGVVRAVDLYPSVIRSRGRLSYDAVAEFLAGTEDAVPEGVRSTLRWLRTAAARIGSVRAARGGVELAREEAYVTLDRVTGEPLGVEPRTDTDAHRLVERLMVAANEAVATWIVDRGLPGLFRVHDEPLPEAVERLATFARNFGLETGFGKGLTPRGLAAFEAQFSRTPLAPALRTVLGKALGPARYTVHPSPHFGLAAPLYAHFTSPIRRYADLVVHRVIKRYLAGDRTMVAGDASFETLAVHIGRAALAANKAETERHRMLLARLFASRVGEHVACNVISVQPFGLVAQIKGTGATGTIAIDALEEGPYRADLAAQALVSPTRRYAVGDALDATIAGAHEELGRIELVPARS